MCVCVCVCVCARACVRACVRALLNFSKAFGPTCPFVIDCVLYIHTTYPSGILDPGGHLENNFKRED